MTQPVLIALSAQAMLVDVGVNSCDIEHSTRNFLE